MDFAKKYFCKYGWKEGDGLGKNSDGIAKPLRATLKFDNAGFGANLAESDFNNHWWERVFNDAANNVKVNKTGESITMDLKSEEDVVEISTKGYSLKILKKAKESRKNSKVAENTYENFLQAATLTSLGGEIENPDRIEACDIEVAKIKVLTDEELFKACGGRTAHKGARHGLKLSGKLLRLEQQEQELLAKMMAARNCGEEGTGSTRDTKDKKLKKKNDDDKQYEAEDGSTKDSENKKKKKKRKHKETQECNEECDEKKSGVGVENNSNLADEQEPNIHEFVSTCSISLENDCDSQPKPKKKKKRQQEADLSEISTSIVQENHKASKSKKKKKKNKTDNEDIEISINIMENIQKKKKNKKKKKTKPEQE